MVNHSSIPDGLSYTKARLWILGLHGNVQIYLNGQLIKKHVNSSTSYFFDLDKKLLKKKNNLLEIKLSKFDVSGNTFDFRYPKYPKQLRPMGVAREVYLEFFPEKYLDNIILKYKENKLYLNYELYIADSSRSKNDKTVKIEEEITAPSGTIIHKRFEYLNNKKIKKSFKRELNIIYPSEWSYDSPKFYTIKISINSSNSNYYSHVEKIGLRNIKTVGTQLSLNSQKLEIKGINYRFNFTNDFDYLNQAKIDLNIIKEIGFNSVRFVNYIPHPAIAKHADSLGLLLFIDTGFWRLPSNLYTNNQFFDIGKLITTEASNTFSNHPSVIGIGIGNEPNINISAVRKFTIVLKKYLNDNFNYLTYLSPINYQVKSGRRTM